MRDNVTADNANVVTLDAVDTTTGTVLASRVVTRQQCGMAYQNQGFSLPLTSQAGHTLEFRVFWHDTSYVKLQQVRVQSRANGVTETDQYDGDGNRVSRTRAGVTTTYGFGRWEQEGAIQRKYYSFQGQVVAIRDGTTVTYLHGDHLGSVSATTNASGVLTSMQHYDPWGQVLAGNVTQTTRNFTGQYLDATGLLYDTARYYDPTLGRFISADSIAPGFGNPQNRNRYSYALNNPLKYTDPTGHCVEGFDETLAGCESYLNVHGWNLQLAQWTDDTLRVVAESVRDLKAAAGWSISDYSDTMTNNGKYSLRLNRTSGYFWDGNRPADVDMRGSTIIMNVYDALFKDTPQTQHFNLVHEQAHVWDTATGGSLNGGTMSGDMMNATGSSVNWFGGYQVGGVPASSYGKNDQREDWAETVAAAVYPDGARAIDDRGNPLMGTLRQNYISAFLPDAQIFNGTYKLNKAK